MGWGKRVAIGAGVAGAAFVLAGLPLYVFPARDEPRAVDAIYVIGPPTAVRIDLAESMIADGLSDTLVVSITDWEPNRVRYPRAVAVCEEPQAYTVYCHKPSPFTTRGEMRWMRELIDENGWESVAVITTRPHISRTRVITKRCWDGDVLYLAPDEDLGPLAWIYHYFYQTGAFVKVGLERGC
ncbi:hypothetical protein [Demequina maris]|uniref:hypothetical protein n=1 Tax=Demequina maris TaxID=1638982 RepID=UPI000786124A|nr:hypothetical protein [Demequina maris]